MRIASLLIVVVAAFILASCAHQQRPAQTILTDPPSIYISREVHRPGRYPWTEGMTLTDAVALAGGLTDFAGNRIQIRHADGTTESHQYKQIKKHDTNDPVLRVGDRIRINGAFD